MSKNDKNTKIQDEGSKKLDLIDEEQGNKFSWKDKHDKQTIEEWKAEFSYNPPTVKDMVRISDLMTKEDALIYSNYGYNSNKKATDMRDFLEKKKKSIKRIIDDNESYQRTESNSWKNWKEVTEKKGVSNYVKDYKEKLQEKVKTIKIKDLEARYVPKELHDIRQEELTNIISWLALLKREIFVLENDMQKNRVERNELIDKLDMVDSSYRMISRVSIPDMINDELNYRRTQSNGWKNWKKNLDAKGGNIEKWKSEFDERIKLEDIFWKREISAARSLLEQENLMLNAWSVISNGEKDKNYQKEMREFLNLRSEEIENLEPRGFNTQKEEVTHYREYDTMIPAQYFDSEHSPKKLEKMLQYQRRKLSNSREYLTFINAIRRGPIGIIDFVEGLSEIRKNLKFLDEKEKEIPFLETTRTTEWQNWKEAFDKKSFDHWKEEFTKSNISDTEYPNKIQSEKHQIKTYRILLTRKLSVFIYEKQSTERYLKWNEEKSESDYHPRKEIITNQTKKLAELKSRIGDLKNTLEKLEKMEKVLESKKPSIFRRISDTISAPFKKVRGDTNHKNTQKNVTPQTSKQPKENANNVQSVAEQHETQAIVGQLISEHGVKDVTDVVHKQNKLDHKLGEVGKSASPDSLTKA